MKQTEIFRDSQNEDVRRYVVSSLRDLAERLSSIKEENDDDVWLIIDFVLKFFMQPNDGNVTRW